MIRFVRDAQPPYSHFKQGMVRDVGAVLNAQFIASGEAVDFVEQGRLYPPAKVLVQQNETYNDPAGQSQSLSSRAWILEGATAGQDSGWLPLFGGQFRLAYALDSGTTNTTFSVDLSEDGVTESTDQAFTGNWASSTGYEDTQVRQVSNISARFFRFNVLTGGPLSVLRIL